MTSPTVQRVPYDPLADMLEQTTLARIVGVHRKTIYRWVARGVPVFAADEIAVALGYHPCELWPTDWWEAVA